MFKVFASALVALAIPAAALAQATTRCAWEAGKWVCREERQRPSVWETHAAKVEAERARRSATRSAEALEAIA